MLSDTDLDIGEVIARSGVPASTLRYYEQRQLITSTGRRGQRRQYAPDVLIQLALIAMARAAGFPLDDIATMFTDDGRPHLDRNLLSDKAHELDRTIAELTTVRDTLRHAAACPAPTHMQCPAFRAMLTAASGIELTS
ncbi:helix-turn-helix domain-containing protein [Nocardia sp. NBC_01503]|uniref:helix-turn-helix domain-containing protein n=1 Tax=Nocardia sp. NBC_01503 TaxID=2975997 RepID=UPI002E7AC407|nr:helix-turn-helix domain-containing protein [Nocardia sp. NBC_01503]WTL31385.1 helix-turn-helix domain-containing protein [Nocardia sp. NBC_01503]